jgi:hypothetical protein
MNTVLASSHLMRTLSLVSIASLANLAFAHSALAANLVLNDGFESNLSDWQTLGDSTTQNTFQGISPRTGSSQGLLTTSCPATPFAGGECFDTQDTTNYRQDDPQKPSSSSTFNFSGSDQGDANGNNLGLTSNLQNFLGLGSNALNIPRTGGSITGTRTPKEGSAIQQTITLEQDSVITFNWNYLTNDGTHPIFGNQDYSFVTIYNVNSNPRDRSVQILGDSTGSISTPITSGQTSFEKAGGYQSYKSQLLPKGTYVIGAGVVDVDGTGISSGLLLDNFEVVPFDFSATTGLGLVAGVFGLSRLRRRLKSSC